MSHRPRTQLALEFAIAIVLAALPAQASWAAPRTFVLRDLGTLDGMASFGTSVNDLGQVLGVAIVDMAELRSFLWERGTMTELGAGTLSAIDLNNRGQILLQDFYAEPDAPGSCYLRDGQAIIRLESPDGSQCRAVDLNSRGQVVGTISTAPGGGQSTRAFLWESGSFTDLGTLGGDWAIALGMNDRGQVVGGSAKTPFGSEHAFLWEAGKMTDLGAPGAAWSRAYAINNRGQVAVQSGSHVYIWEAGSMTDLGTLGGDMTYPVAINILGQVLVVVHDAATGGFRDGVWEDRRVTWLPTLGGGRPTAFRLNDRGQVVGSDRLDAAGVAHGVLWTPRAALGRGHH